MFKLHAPPWGQSTLTGKNRKRGFSLTELVVVILIVSIISATAFAGSTVIIKKAKKAKVESDLYTFQSSIEAVLTAYNEQPGFSLLSNKERLENVMFALNDELLPSCVLSSITDTLFSGGIQKTIATEPSTDFLICESQKRDPWGHPYYVIIDQQIRVSDGGVPELFVTVVTAGPNGVLNLDGEIDADDMFLLTSNIDGKITSGIYIASDAVPTIADGSAPATSYVEPLSAPVNNGITLDDLVFNGSGSVVDPGASTFYIAVTVTNGVYSAPPTIDKNGSASVTITPNSGCSLPNFVSVIGATSSYNSSTGVISLSNPKGNVSITAACPPNAFAISTAVTNGSYTGATSINSSGNASVTISADSGYILPDSVTVTGATHTYNSSTGVISLSNPTGSVTITANCPIISYISFTSPGNFSIATGNNKKNWDGTLEWSDGVEDWEIWDGTSAIATTTGTINVRGTGNSHITGSDAINRKWVLTGSNINCSGNIETLLDYSAVVGGEHPSMANNCFYNLFYDCAPLISAPELPATTLRSYCYNSMFDGCTNLTTAPVLPATTLAESCYEYMFQGCTSLASAPVLPATTLASSCYFGMFSDCTSLVSAPALSATTMETYCYQYMFNGCTNLTTPPALPATTLAEYCYQYMFDGCTKLTTAPALPATTLMDSCYGHMFNGCTSLASAPALPATTLADSCYSSMFEDCTSLTTAPALPATTLSQSCYSNMLKNCSSLKFSETRVDEYQYAYRVPSTGTGTTATSWNNNMFAGTEGTYTGNPNINTTYYTTAPVVGIPVYTISTTVTGGTFTGSAEIYAYDTSSVIISANSGYRRPNTVVVTGAESSYNSATGLITLSNPTGNVTITAACPQVSGDFISFNSPSNNFTLGTGNNTKNWDGTLEWSDGVKAWATWDGSEAIGTETGTLNVRGTGNTVITGDNSDNERRWVLTGSIISCSGNIETILGYGTVAGGGHPTMGAQCFGNLFYNCTSLVSAPALPATNISSRCYYAMFQGCTSLTIAPVLPATTLTTGCYRNMFYGCTALASAPELPATTLAGNCYQNMFHGCTSLAMAPALPATTLASSCYYGMFSDCTDLISAPTLSSTTLAPYCYRAMFSGCTALTSAPTLPATTLTEYCYNSMFQDCTSLELVPALSAITLAERCCYSMFQGCISLTSAPALPATTLAEYCCYSMYKDCTALESAPDTLPAMTLSDCCYKSMFQNCSSLTSAPALPATTLAQECYYSMFLGCTSLTSAPALPAITLAQECYYAMFQDCTSLTSTPALPATTLADSCYYTMFKGCTSLTSISALPATTTVYYCYRYMFEDCSSLKLSETQIDDYQYPYRIPMDGTITGDASDIIGMFRNTGGTFVGSPNTNKTYYTTNPPVNPTS